MTTLIYFGEKYKIPNASLERRFQCAIICELAQALKEAPPKTTAIKWFKIRDAAIKKAHQKILEQYKERKTNGKKT